ncbi:MAG: RNA pseudouridine synthase, partial [Verrucomicrobia bacterium]|nr:RNA pseudouridine synthase [Verrucomicrobiota bacterium]
TEFKTLATRTHPQHGEISLVEVSPKTGRLHQIRAHFDHLGHPVVNDKIYGKKDEVFINYIDKAFKKTDIIGRHCLHSSKLEFKFESGSVDAEIDLPSDMAEIWNDGRET